MAKAMSSLVGHKTLIYKVTESSASNARIKVRVIRHFTDLGEVLEFL
jgi:hypothetical protein